MTARRWLWLAVFLGIIVALSYLSQTRTRPLYRGIYLLEVEPPTSQTH